MNRCESPVAYSFSDGVVANPSLPASNLKELRSAPAV
jgi:hypothetical protein